MGALVKSELLKYFSTRMWWGMALGLFLAGAGMAALFAFFFTLDGGGLGPDGEPIAVSDLLGETGLAKTVYTSGASLGYVLTLAIGVLSIGQEYRHKTVTGTFLAEPRRLRVMVAKIVALLGVGAFNGLVYLIGSVAAGGIVLSIRGFAAYPEPASMTRTLLMVLLVLGLWALIGLGIGILIPNQIAALLVAIGAAWIVEPILGVVLSFQSWGEDVGKFFPSQATTAMLETFGGMEMDGMMGGAAMLSWWAAALVLTGYAAIMAGLGSWLTLRRDVS